MQGDLKEFYESAGGNPYGVPVEVLNIAGFENSMEATLQWIADQGYELGLDDTGVFDAFEKYAVNQRTPRYVIINGLAGSSTHQQWEVLHNETGFTGVEFFREIIDKVRPGGAHFFSDLPDTGGGWRESPWLGWLVPSGESWAYHDELGWFFVPAESTDSSFYFYDDNLGWMWTAEGTYPSIYSFNRAAWLDYSKGSGEWFYDWSLSQWIQL